MTYNKPCQQQNHVCNKNLFVCVLGLCYIVGMSYEVGTYYDLTHLNGKPKKPALQRVSASIERAVGTRIVFIRELADSNQQVRVPVALR